MSSSAASPSSSSVARRAVASVASSPWHVALVGILWRRLETGPRAGRRHLEESLPSVGFFLFLSFFLFVLYRGEEKKSKTNTLSIIVNLSQHAMLASLLSASLHRSSSSRAAASLTASCSGRLLASIGGRNLSASLLPFSSVLRSEEKTQPLPKTSPPHSSPKQPPRLPSPPFPSLSPPPPPEPPPSSACARATPSASWPTGR